MKIDVFTPGDCSKIDIYAFVALVNYGGRVVVSGLEKRIRGAHTLAFCRIASEIVSVAGIKQPDEPHTEHVFQSASSNLSNNSFNLEYGWAVTKEGHGKHGYASATASVLLRNLVSPIFATTQSDNVAMQKILEKNGFHKVGMPYNGRTDMLILYVRGN